MRRVQVPGCHIPVKQDFVKTSLKSVPHFRSRKRGLGLVFAPVARIEPIRVQHSRFWAVSSVPVSVARIWDGRKESSTGWIVQDAGKVTILTLTLAGVSWRDFLKSKIFHLYSGDQISANRGPDSTFTVKANNKTCPKSSRYQLVKIMDQGRFIRPGLEYRILGEFLS